MEPKEAESKAGVIDFNKFVQKKSEKQQTTARDVLIMDAVFNALIQTTQEINEIAKGLSIIGENGCTKSQLQKATRTLCELQPAEAVTLDHLLQNHSKNLAGIADIIHSECVKFTFSKEDREAAYNQIKELDECRDSRYFWRIISAMLNNTEKGETE